MRPDRSDPVRLYFGKVGSKTTVAKWDRVGDNNKKAFPQIKITQIAQRQTV
jgi:hypothetical protein